VPGGRDFCVLVVFPRDLQQLDWSVTPACCLLCVTANQHGATQADSSGGS
jgi:hypothetical protein